MKTALGKNIDSVRKAISWVFNITVETDLKTAEYLDVTLNLKNIRRIGKLKYVNVKSDHHKRVIDKIPISIGCRATALWYIFLKI